MLWLLLTLVRDIVPDMDTKDKQFQMRLNESEGLALEQLSKRAGVSKSNYLRRYIRKEAKKKKIPVWP